MLFLNSMLEAARRPFRLAVSAPQAPIGMSPLAPCAKPECIEQSISLTALMVHVEDRLGKHGQDAEDGNFTDTADGRSAAARAWQT